MNWKKGFRRITLLISILVFFVPALLLLTIAKQEFEWDVPFVGIFSFNHDTPQSILAESLFLGFWAFVITWILYFLTKYSLILIIIPSLKWIKRGFTDNERKSNK
jgi:hypothetical protein